MRNNTAAALAAAAMLLAARGASAALSEPALVDCDLRSARWTTVFTNAVPLAWEWDANAAYATLDVVGMNGAVTTNLYKNATSNWLWQAFAPAAPSAEDVYDLTLTFYAGDDAAVGALTARLAVVKGAFGAAEVDAVSSSLAWTKVKENAVIDHRAGEEMEQRLLLHRVHVHRARASVRRRVKPAVQIHPDAALPAEARRYPAAFGADAALDMSFHRFRHNPPSFIV